ncbi:MAG: hypothetical protein KGQ41_09065 [Alphaproteobacteria bacterium]|nr:hypothetical protein [Alphaproteobacteria bacterium]
MHSRSQINARKRLSEEFAEYATRTAAQSKILEVVSRIDTGRKYDKAEAAKLYVVAKLHIQSGLLKEEVAAFFKLACQSLRAAYVEARPMHYQSKQWARAQQKFRKEERARKRPPRPKL